MKKYIVFLLALGFFLPQLYAQREGRFPADEEVKPEEPVNNIFKISPFHFAEGTFLLSYERMLNEGSMSVMLSAGLHSRQRWFDDSEQFGVQEEVQLRFYVLPPKNTSVRNRRFLYFKGLYAGPYVAHRYRNQTVSVFDWVLQQNVSTPQNVHEISGGVMLGAQIAFGNRLYLDLFTGGGVKRSIGSEADGRNITIFDVGYNGVVPKAGFQLGIGF